MPKYSNIFNNDWVVQYKCIISADNTNGNFGGINQAGTNNVLSRLNQFFDAKLIATGCNAHILNNAIKNASNLLQIDLKKIIINIYFHFHTYTSRTLILKKICQDLEIEYKPLLWYSATRWLALAPSLNRIIYDVFIETLFLHKCVLRVEGNQVEFGIAAKKISFLIDNVECRMKAYFLPSKFIPILLSFNNNQQLFLKSKIIGFYEALLNYLKKWTLSVTLLSPLLYIIDRTDFTWTNVEQCVNIYNDINKLNHICRDDIFNKFVIIESSIQNLKSIMLWKEFYENIEFKKLFQFYYSLHSSNAYVEGIFTMANNYWTDQKTNLNVKTLKSVILLR
ncbi:hypothetical protein A3Q56_04020 [Intoshia linei]|uniref:HAT C-terminal dimerisation domain-containing protein n=1 Tax=Intoshia linei TaxID=1819745 RepID=A0A177B275_9BILA|nr:hypothetical protein A3Q56_04020 [Intoshia linei]